MSHHHHAANHVSPVYTRTHPLCVSRVCFRKEFLKWRGTCEHVRAAPGLCREALYALGAATSRTIFTKQVRTSRGTAIDAGCSPSPSQRVGVRPSRPWVILIVIKLLFMTSSQLPDEKTPPPCPALPGWAARVAPSAPPACPRPQAHSPSPEHAVVPTCGSLPPHAHTCTGRPTFHAHALCPAAFLT